MKTTIFSIFIATLFFSSCGKKKDSYYTENVIINNFEEIAHLTPCASNLVKRGVAHTGNYSCYVDSTLEYSLTYISKLAEISSRPIKKLKVSAWIMRPNLNSKSAFVVEITKDNNIVNYVKEDFETHLKKPSEWVKVTAEIDGTKNTIFEPGNILKIYVWRGGVKEISYMDDLKIEIED